MRRAWVTGCGLKTTEWQGLSTMEHRGVRSMSWRLLRRCSLARGMAMHVELPLQQRAAVALQGLLLLISSIYSAHRNSLITAAKVAASLKPWPQPSHLCRRAWGRRAVMRSAFSYGTCVVAEACKWVEGG